MEDRGFKNQIDMSNEAQFGPADVLARPWLVHALLGLGFTQPVATGYGLRSSPAPRHTPTGPVGFDYVRSSRLVLPSVLHTPR